MGVLGKRRQISSQSTVAVVLTCVDLCNYICIVLIFISKRTLIDCMWFNKKNRYLSEAILYIILHSIVIHVKLKDFNKLLSTVNTI